MDEARASHHAGPEWAKRVFAVTLFCDDLAESVAFYRTVFEMPVIHEDAQSCAFQFPGGIALLNGPTDRPWGPRTVTLADPSGHCWELSS